MPTDDSATMAAVVRDRFGPPEVLSLQQTPRPQVAEDGVRVRVHAASVNRADWYDLTGTPYVARPMTGLRRPKTAMFGTDFAGVVESVGKDVTDLAPGDEVFGAANGALAEFVSVRVGVAKKPERLSYEEAAAVPVAGVTALQGLRDKGGVGPGQHVLINGASGGVGTFAVQIAKALGAEVTAVCSTGNVQQAQSLGADHVIDYTREEFTRSGQRYDVLFDNAGNRSWLRCRRVLARQATVVLVGGSSNRFIGPLGHLLAMRLASLGSRRRVVFFIAKVTPPDLNTLGELLESGQVRPVIDQRFALADVAAAMRYVGDGHARGKAVVNV